MVRRALYFLMGFIMAATGLMLLILGITTPPNPGFESYHDALVISGIAMAVVGVLLALIAMPWRIMWGNISDNADVLYPDETRGCPE